MKDSVLIGVTGASGTVYARRLAEILKEKGYRVEGILTGAADQVMRYERELKLLDYFGVVHGIENYFAPPASGTSKYKAMVVLPCSMGTLGKIACGIGDNLLVRAADVFLKEGRQLIVAPREMPFNKLHLENMLRLHEAGAILVGTSPFFYYHPETIDDLVDTVVGKILDQMKVDHTLFKPWMQE